jgi:hypothetical protein
MLAEKPVFEERQLAHVMVLSPESLLSKKLLTKRNQ